MTKVYMLPIQRVKDHGDDFFARSFPERTKRAEAFAHEDDRLRCLGVAVLLNRVLDLSENDIRTGEYGKPFSDKTDKQFSISHSGDYVALAVSDDAVGVDIQKMDKKVNDSVYRILTENEKRYAAKDKPSDFIKLWTIKESLSKAAGLGLRMHFSDVDVSGFFEGRSIVFDGDEYYIDVVEIDNYYLGICTKNRHSSFFIDKM
ncbi:MAG: 4'-phosphopantetheinyl transferase superfamily protein [Clostridia bacterium]|nr:4'-phosphopantetheinyl transferase superfamily protein [Clostridia bacterium]